MTLDEAIKHAEKVAEEQDKAAKEWRENQVRKCESIRFAEMDYTHENECKKCAEEHRQLAEWLKELKTYREREPSYEAGYNDAKREIALSGEYKRAYDRGYEQACKDKIDMPYKEESDDLPSARPEKRTETHACDCISRQAVLEQINCWIGSGEYKYTNATCYLTRRMQDISSVTPQPERKSWKWIPVSERLPEKHGDYLVTIENGDVFNCYFNPDYCYDGYDNGAFTYTQEYFDHETIGSLGSEEFAFDGVVAWVPYEPYKVESEDKE